MVRVIGLTKKVRRESCETGFEQVGLRFFLKDVTDRLFLIWKRKEFQRART